jgi:membrane protein required for colicin V production
VDLIWVDYLILVLIGVSALLGLFHGLIREVFSLLIWGAAVFLGMRYARGVSDALDPLIAVPSVRLVAAFAAVFVVALMVGGLLRFLLGKLVAGTGLGGTDRLAGLVFGLVRGALLVAVLVWFAGSTPLSRDPWWRESKLIPPFQSMADWLGDQLPGEIAGSMPQP